MLRTKRWRTLSVALAAALALAACGGDDADDATSTTTAAAAGGAFPRDVEHELGTSRLEAAPERVLALGDYSELDDLLALGVTPVAFGYTDSWDTGSPPWQLDAGIEDVERFDATGDLSLEAIAGFDPDLIVAMPYPAEELYEELTAIAPTVVVDWSAPWPDALATIGAAVGKDDLAAELHDDVEAAIAAAATEVADLAGRPIMVGSYYGDVLYLQGDASGFVQLLRDLGLEVLTTTEEPLAELSLEQVEQLAPADILLSLATDLAAARTAEASPLWQSLPAVQAGRYTAIQGAEARSLGDGFNALSYGYVLGHLVPTLRAAAEGQGVPLG